MKSERLLLHYCLWGAAQSSKYWRLVPGCVRAHSQLSAFEMSPTGTWTPSLSSPWWWLKRCNSMVTLLPACNFWSSGPHVQCVIGTLPSLCSSIFRPRKLKKPYTRAFSKKIIKSPCYCKSTPLYGSSDSIISWRHSCIPFGLSVCHSQPICGADGLCISPFGAHSFGLSLLTVVSLPDDLTVISPGGPARRMLVVKKRRNWIVFIGCHPTFYMSQAKWRDQVCSHSSKGGLVFHHIFFARCKRGPFDLTA